MRVLRIFKLARNIELETKNTHLSNVPPPNKKYFSIHFLPIVSNSKKSADIPPGFRVSATQSETHTRKSTHISEINKSVEMKLSMYEIYKNYHFMRL